MRFVMGLCILLIPWVGSLSGCRPEAVVTVSQEKDAVPVSAATMDRAFTSLEGDTDPAFVQRFTVLKAEERLDVLDAALSRVFPEGTPNATGEREILAVLAYVSQTLKLKYSARHLGSEVLAEGQAFCYGMARAFEALCRRLGLPARVNAVHNFEYMQAHNMAEVFYNGCWHLFDPTYGVFFYDKDVYDGTGHIPSSRDLFAGAMPGRYAFMVSDPLWTGSYVPGTAPKPLSDTFRYRGAFTLRQLYDRVLSVGFPFVQSDAGMYSFPITIDMADQVSLNLGAVNGATEDLEGRRENASYPRYYGAACLGEGAMGGAFHTLTFKAAAPGRFKMTYHFLPGSVFTDMNTVELRDIVVERCERGADAWAVWFRLQSTEGLFLVLNRGNTAMLDAATVTREE